LKSHDGILHFEFKDLTELGVEENTLWTASKRGSKCWTFVSDPDDGRKVLVPWGGMPEQWQKAAEAKYGDPVAYMAITPLRRLIRRDIDAFKFFDSYTIDGTRKLPKGAINYVELYTGHAELLNMITYVLANKKALKKELCMTMDRFWTSVAAIVKADYSGLPQTVDRLKKRWREYRTAGYGCLVSKKFGNQNTAKLKNDEHISVLLKLLSAHQNLEDAILNLAKTVNFTTL
jgi:hypothetical protein